MSTAPSLPLPLAARRGERAVAVEAAGELGRREAALRSAALAAMAGIALVQAIELPSLLVGGVQRALLSMAATGLCLGCSVALAGAPARASRPLWRAVAATAAVVLAGWAAPRAFALPQGVGAEGDWAAMPGLACGALAAVCLALAAAAARPTARSVAAAAAVAVALGPGLGALLVSVGPGPAGGETSLAADVHVHAHLTAGEADILFRPGRNGNHYLTPVTIPPHAPPLGAALVVAAALAFVSGGIGHLRLRCARGRPAAASGVERRGA